MRGGWSWICAFALAALIPCSSFADEPWRLGEVLSGLELSGEHRTRIETLSDRFRIGRRGNDQILVARTILKARLQLAEPLQLVVEFMDSRAGQDDASTPITSGIVNTTDWLQINLELNLKGPFKGRSRARLGRMTMDVGDRRLVARNRFRNTINAFTGLDLVWRRGPHTLRGFYTLPVQRRPGSSAELRANDARADRENLDVIFWGAYARTELPWKDRAEFFVFGLHEQDDSDRSTRNRELYTPGFRIWRPAESAAWDYQFESVFQFGHSRSSTLSAIELEHKAHFHHAEIGYSFDSPGSPRLVAQYDYASGDASPGDTDNGRFDTLFGARRFDFGPTGIYGPFARANLSTPGLRLSAKPCADLTGMVSIRGFWLASDNDAWVASGAVDPAGDSGDFIASQIELRVRWDALPRNLRIEAGAAWLFAGEFVDDAPNSNGVDRSTYAYLQATLHF